MTSIRHCFSLAAILFEMATLCVHAAPPLMQKVIHDEYNEGDFEKVISHIDKFCDTTKSYGREDSIFIAKHLAVVYSANPQTREKGKYYMFQLLELLPSAKLVDMYVSDEIDRIFEKVREEFQTHQQPFGIDTTTIVLPKRLTSDSGTAQIVKTDPPKAPPSWWKKHWYWIAAGGGTVVATTVTAYFLAGDDNPGKTYVIEDNP